MPVQIRANFERGYDFFAVVTYGRATILTTPLARRILRYAKDVQARYP